MKNLITENIGLKILSFLIAFFLWAYVIITVNPTVTRDVRVQLQIANLDRNSFYLSTKLPMIKIRYKAKRKLVMDRSLEEEISAQVNMQKVNSAREYDLKVSANVPAGLEIISFSPSKVKIGIGNMIRRKLQPSPHITFTDPDLYLAEFSVYPEMIEINGRQEIMGQTLEAKIFLEIQKPEKTSRNQRISLLDSKKKPVNNDEVGIIVSPPSLKIRYRAEKMPEKTVPVKPVLENSLSKDLLLKEVKVDPDKVVVKAVPSELKKISSVSTEAIDLESLTESLITKTAVHTDLADISISPKKVELTIKIIQKKIRKIRLKLSAGEGFLISPSPTIEVTVETQSQISDPLSLNLSEQDPISQIRTFLESKDFKIIELPQDIKLIRQGEK